MKCAFAYFPTGREDYLLISQNRFTKYRGDAELIYPVVPASGLTMLKKAGHSVEMIDSVAEKLSVEDFLKRLEGVELLVYETKTPVVKANWEFAREIKKKYPLIKIAAVGDHVSVLPMETMENSYVDFVLAGGDFDVSMARLAGFLEGKGKMPSGCYYRKDGKILDTGKYELVEDLDVIPFIDRDIFPWERYHEALFSSRRVMYLLGSRGCPYKCTFCSWPQMFYGGRTRFRSAKNVVDEISHLVEKYGVKEFFLDDDTFTCNRKWVFEICNEIINKGLKIVWECNGRVDNTDSEMLALMKKSGCRLIKYGIESVHDESLKRIRKGYNIEQVKRAFEESRSVGILRHGTVMIGYPWESYDDMVKTVEFVKSLNVDTVQFSIPIVYPGTGMFAEAEKNEWLQFGRDWSRYDMSEPTLKHPSMSAKEITDLCAWAWKQVYFQPKFIFRKIAGIRRASDLKWLFNGVGAVLKGHVSTMGKKECSCE